MLLKVGSSGDDVKELQSLLKIGADGVFGKGTETAVKEFQAAHGLDADGIVGNGTWAALHVGAEPVVEATPGAINFNALTGKIPASALAIFPEAFAKYEINSPLRAAHFLAQIAHESGDFTIMTESMNYSTPARLVEIWPSRFSLDGSGGKRNAHEYVKNQEKLAEAVYGGRKELGNSQPGDGFRFRGGGWLQLTGRDAYKGYAAYLGKSVEDTADLLRSDKHFALDAACWEYCVNMKLNRVADQGTGDDIIKKITKVVNGGYIGLADRTSHFKTYYKLLTA
jgi:putative chitinase